MKYIRHKINIRVSPKVRVMLLFFVVLPAMAILGAGIINKLIVAPYLSEQAKASETSMTASSGRIYSFYLLQAGVFSNGDNAQTMASQIRAAGFKACSIKDGEVYRVVAGAAADKSSLQQYSTSLQQAGYITLCKSFETNEASLVNSPMGTKEYISAAGELINAMLEYTSSTQKLDSVKIETLEGYASAVRKQYDSIKDKAGEFNVSLLEDLEEYIRQADNLDKRTEITWECIASYGRMAEGINK
jgi:hypothetical protein